MRRITALGLLLLSGAAPAVHPPATAPERALDAIIKRVDADPNAADNLIGGYSKSFHGTVDYKPMLTGPLLATIAAADKRLVQENCGSRPMPGDLCGLDYNPVTCTQDNDKTYLYRTETADNRTARIAYTWISDPDMIIATYRMVEQGGRWKIDGVACARAIDFNMGGSFPY